MGFVYNSIQRLSRLCGVSYGITRHDDNLLEKKTARK